VWDREGIGGLEDVCARVNCGRRCRSGLTLDDWNWVRYLLASLSLRLATGSMSKKEDSYGRAMNEAGRLVGDRCGRISG